MNANADLFALESENETVIVTPQASMFEINGAAFAAESHDVLEYLDHLPARKVVIDFGQTADCDSSALGFCARLWKQIRRRQGALAMCNVSDNERAMMRVTKLDRLWPICASREEALAKVSR